MEKEAKTQTEIIGLRYLPLSGEFEATVVEHDGDGVERSKLVAASKSLTRLVAMIRPAQPVNL